ncbi:MAG: alpha/beta fold hydrolase [Acidobacteriota bacterium]
MPPAPPTDSEDRAPTGIAARGWSGHRLRRVLYRLAVAYLVLLVLSHGVRLLRGRTPEPPSGRQSITVAEVAGEDLKGDDVTDDDLTTTGRSIDLAWLEWTPLDDAPREPSTILLLHGSPGDAENFNRLAPLLAAADYRVVAPDLPGFGASSPHLADYSIRAHARYVARLLEHLDLDSVHVLGFSMGGGVALHLGAEEAPQRVDSLLFLGSIGVQELELFGQYGLNHAVHGLQLVILHLVREATPHFGLFDSPFLGIPYARNFYDTDQRPLRGLLEEWRAPMLIVHGEGDVLVPYAAALEHHRIVPQAELVTFDANHFLPFTWPDELVAPIVDFVRAVDSGTAATRATAAPERLERAATGTPFELPPATGPTLLVWMVLLAAATWVSEDLTCIGAGLLVARGTLGFTPAAVACGLGIFVGDLGLYAIGRVGQPWLTRAPLRWLVGARELARSRAFFAHRGPWMIFASRFLPGLRVPTYVTAGLLGMSFGRFALWLALPVAVWTPLLVGAARAVGEPLFALIERWQGRAAVLFVGALVCLWIVLAVGRKLATWRGRRLLLGRWRRLTRWEYWPLWVVYPSLLPAFLGLALRHRSLTAYTAVNPGIPAGGGLLGESKAAILDALDARHVAPWRRIPNAPAERRAAADAFVAAHGLPVVVKPDVGERGRGVVIARDRDTLAATLAARTDSDLLIQRYVGGVELGIFYARRPDEATGRILSITDKRLPRVTGDGTSTLERLILADPRAVAMAKVYLARFESRLDEVPADGETVRLVEVGTHCRGALFLDGAAYRTSELEAAVDEIACSFDGFQFGRFDLKAPSFEHFERGEGLQVLELNGLSSESTHIYDPRHSFAYGWRTLAAQWALAFEIGAAQHARGHRRLGVVELLRLVLTAWRKDSSSRTPAGGGAITPVE